MENWFLRITQLLVAFAVGSAAIYWKWTDNPTLVGAWGLIAAIGITMLYGRIADWWINREVSRLSQAERAEIETELRRLSKADE